jgi:hypothetical protein
LAAWAVTVRRLSPLRRATSVLSIRASSFAEGRLAGTNRAEAMSCGSLASWFVKSIIHLHPVARPFGGACFGLRELGSGFF